VGVAFAHRVVSFFQPPPLAPEPCAEHEQGSPLDPL
jgi:hypothetical protein